jgi:hypothetical protein
VFEAKFMHSAGCRDAVTARTVSMARLKKASRPLTRKRQIEAALELLKPPVDKREQYRHTIEQALDRLTAPSEVDRATKKAKRAWTAALESMQAACVTYAAAGGPMGLASESNRPRCWARPDVRAHRRDLSVAVVKEAICDRAGV